MVKNIKKLVAAIAVSVFTVSLAGCKMIEKTPEAIKKTVVAKIGKETITRGEFDEKMAPVLEQVKAQYGEDYEKNSEAVEVVKNEKSKLLSSLVDEKVLMLKGEELKLIPEQSVIDEDINKRLTDIKAIYGNDEAKYNEALKQAGFDETVLKQYIKNQVIVTKVYEHMIKDVKVDDAAIEKYYNENKDVEFTQKPGARMAHILVDTEEKAKEIKAKLDKKEDFAKLAAEYGTDGTKDTGGDLGFVEYEQENFDKDFLAGAKNLKEGEISNPVKTQFGYHIIKVSEIRNEPKVTPLEEVKEDIKATLTENEENTAYKNTLEQWKKDLKVKTYEDKIY